MATDASKLTERKKKRLSWWKGKLKNENSSSPNDLSQVKSTEVKQSNKLESKAKTIDNNEDIVTSKVGKLEKIPSKKSYVLFVGNLPYDVTKDEIENHFIRTGGVKAVRLPTVKGTGKPRGFAYVEFENKTSHQFALRLHHSKLKGRQINVEFTSIGGKSEKRLVKLKQKNDRLARFKVDPDVELKKAGKRRPQKRFNKNFKKKL